MRSVRHVRIVPLLLLTAAVFGLPAGDESSAHTNTFASTATVKLCAYTGSGLQNECATQTLAAGGNADITSVITVPSGQILPGGVVAFTPAAASVPGPETNTLCSDTLDNDADTKANDGCPRSGTDLESNRCDNSTDDDSADDAIASVSGANDGCPAVGPAESGTACENYTDDDVDTKVNDGCPAVGGAQAEFNAWCDGAADEDLRDDAAGGGPKVNDGCPAVGAAETACSGAVDDDGDTKVNDGCPTAGGIEAEVNECDNSTDDDVDAILNDGCPIVNAPLVGAVAGKAYVDTRFSLLNGPCSSVAPTEVYLMNSSTDNSLPNQYGALPPGAIWSEGPMEPFRDDVNGNSLPRHVERYPEFLNLAFDPDRVGDINGDGDHFDTINGVAENPGASTADWYGTVEPLRPVARYSGSAIGVGNQAQLIQLLVFAPGAFAAYPRPHPLWDLASTTFGYPAVLIVNDPTVAPGPSAPGDACSPADVRVMLWGKTRDNPCLGANPVCPNDDTPCFILCGDNNCINGNTFGVSACPALVDSPNGACSGNDTGGCVRYANPATAGTYYWRVYQQSQRDADDDGIENSLDTCPYTATSGFDPHVSTTILTSPIVTATVFPASAIQRRIIRIVVTTTATHQAGIHGSIVGITAP